MRLSKTLEPLMAEIPEKSGVCDALDRAVRDFQKIVDSPLDVDAHVLSIIWDEIWPALAVRGNSARGSRRRRGIAAGRCAGRRNAGCRGRVVGRAG